MHDPFVMPTLRTTLTSKATLICKPCNIPSVAHCKAVVSSLQAPACAPQASKQLDHLQKARAVFGPQDVSDAGPCSCSSSCDSRQEIQEAGAKTEGFSHTDSLVSSQGVSSGGIGASGLARAPMTAGSETFSLLVSAMGLTCLAALAHPELAHAAAEGAGALDARSIAHLAEQILRPLFTAGTLLYIVRVPMTWYPDIDGNKLPWVLAYAPTEPLLKVTRKVIPLVGGVDVTPIVWVGLISFFNEVLIGPQGILNLIQRQTGSGL